MSRYFLLCLVLGLCCCGSLYQLLGVGEDATSDEIKRAFRKLSVKYHPDRHANDPSMLSKYIEIKRAYQILIDVSQRITYNLHGEEGLAELLKHPLRKGGDFRTQMQMPLATFYEGGHSVFSFRRGQICKVCKGTGLVAADIEQCQECGGSGKMIKEVNVKGNIKKIEMKCKACGGTKVSPKSQCPLCKGAKIQMQPRDLNFQVERGMENGDVVLFKGESEQGFDFYPGDVYVKMVEVGHHLFRRDGRDLRMNMEISLEEAILGFRKEVKHLDGEIVYVEGDNVQDGEDIVIQRKGMPKRGDSRNFGDLLIKMQINFKNKYSQQEKQFLKKIFAFVQVQRQL